MGGSSSGDVALQTAPLQQPLDGSTLRHAPGPDTCDIDGGGEGGGGVLRVAALRSTTHSVSALSCCFQGE
jgi:hypothetical protein